MSERVDLVVIGGGAAGLSAAQTGAAKGARTLLVSSGPLGGECTWNGCVPSKALIETARVAHELRGAAQFGIDAVSVTINLAAVMQRVRTVVESIAKYEDTEHANAGWRP